MFTVTPLHLEIVMNYYIKGDDMPNLNAPAVRDCIEDLERSGMIEDITHAAGEGCSYRTTERGREWLQTRPFLDERSEDLPPPSGDSQP
jgi:DNA-binding PadR family transcriptional regulator